MVAVKSLAKAGVDVNARNSFGNTPLHNCMMYGHSEANRNIAPYIMQLFNFTQVGVNSVSFGSPHARPTTPHGAYVWRA